MHHRQIAQARIDDLARMAERERMARRTRAARIPARVACSDGSPPGWLTP